MSNEFFVRFDENLLRLPSCLAVHAQLHPNLIKFTCEEYVKYIQQFHELNICGIIRKNEAETTVLALAAYRKHLNTFYTIRFEIDDLIVDEKERKHGLGTRLMHYLIDHAKQEGVSKISVHCNPIHTDAHRLFFRLGLTINCFEFDLENKTVLPDNDQIRIIDVTDLPDKENEQLLIRAHEIYQQLRPHLPNDQNEYVKQLRDICRTSPARILFVLDKNDNILGLTCYRITENIQYSKHIYCDDLVTDENRRSSGVGRFLINYMKNEREKLGIDKLILDSGVQRGRAHKFYHREGFYISRYGFSMAI
ncbi:unnamed protein product [Adineta steineri]|uniref:N-acetyltransferase domain-containing protein n=1 Tax=Adineta steineri TaxID=433720 RepID=A0A814TT07_9BILA|nr:unnamed protein product [Adineta steineri]CAF1165470.1 unnamed protein product [Adineta steineri]